MAGSGQAGDSGQSERKDTHVQELARSLNYAGESEGKQTGKRLRPDSDILTNHAEA